MKVRQRTKPIILDLLPAALPDHGEMEDRKYVSTEASRPSHVLEQRQREIEAALRDAARQEMWQRAAAEVSRLVCEAELAAHPHGARLLETRCATVRHGIERFAHARHGWLDWAGWRLQLMRTKQTLRP